MVEPSISARAATSAAALRRRVMMAVFLPIVAILFAATPAYPYICYYFVSSDARIWAGLVLLATVAVCEYLFLATLVEWMFARGDWTVLVARRHDQAWLRRRRLRRFRISAAALSLAFALTAIEVVFRVWSIRPAPVRRPDHGDVTRVDTSANALGIREDWDALADDDPRTRVAFLGDSFTYGDSVEPHETFCHRVEGLLADWGEAGVVTINLGGIGTNPRNQLTTWLEYRDVFRPDVLVHVIYLNDLDFNLRHIILNIHSIAKTESWLGRQSYFWRYAEKQIRYWRAWHDTLDYFRGGLDPEQRQASWSKFKAAIRRCKAAVEDRDAVYCMVVFPWLFQLEEYPLEDVHVRMREFATSLGVPFLDLLEVFEGRDGESLCVNPVNEHPNPRAHGIAAGRIAEFLRASVLPRISSKNHSAP